MAIQELEAAGRQALLIPDLVRDSRLEGDDYALVRQAITLYGWSTQTMNTKQLPPPTIWGTAEWIKPTLQWIMLIPQTNPRTRQIVAMRCLINPATGRHLFSWGNTATQFQLSASQTKLFHLDGIRMIAQALHQRPGS